MEKILAKKNGLTYLPTEILQHLVSYVSTRQRFTLLHVCQALSQPCFWRSLYAHVHINDEPLHVKFVDTITQSAKGNTYIPNLGQYVGTLTLFSEHIITNRQTMATLQQLCPNVTYFNTSHKHRPPPAILPEALPWKNLERISSSLYSDVSLVVQHGHDYLTHLSLSDLDDVDGKPIFESLSFPHLVELIIRPKEFSISLLTDIISACPELQHFTLDGVVLPKLHGDFSDWESLTTSVSIKQLELQCVHTGELSWFKIFGHTFPMVDTLIINYLDVFATVPVMGDDTVEINNSDDEREWMEDNFDVAILKNAFLDMVDTFAHLMHAQLLNISYNNQNLGGYFLFDHWITNGKQQHLHDIQFDYSCKDDDGFSDYEYDWEPAEMDEQQSATVMDFIKSTQHSLRSFHFYVNDALFDSQHNILKTLADCTWLHTLVLRFTEDIHRCYEMETINTILDTLPNLKSLEYPMGLASEPDVEMSYSRDNDDNDDSRRPLARPAPHGLTRFVYNGEIRTLWFLDYIHKRCPYLSVLHLDARQTATSNCLMIHYPKWNLKQLDLGSSGGSRKVTLVVLLESGYTPMRERWYENTPCGGWRPRLDMPRLDMPRLDMSPTLRCLNVDSAPDLVFSYNFIEEVQIFTPSHHHLVF